MVENTADTCFEPKDFKYSCCENGCFYHEGPSIVESDAIASQPTKFIGAQFEYGIIGCNFKAKSGAEFTFFYDKDNATISSSNWQPNKEKNDRFDCKSDNDVNHCPFSFYRK